MSHECPVCGQTCYCGGDIDDCCFNWPKYVDRCTHCPDPNLFDHDWYPEDYPEDEEREP